MEENKYSKESSAEGKCPSSKKIFIGVGAVVFIMVLFFSLFTLSVGNSMDDDGEIVYSSDFMSSVDSSESSEEEVEYLDPFADFPKITKFVWMEVSINGDEPQRITMGLFGENTPITCENFRSLLTGERGEGHSYVGTSFHRIINNFVIQGGDLFTNPENTVTREENLKFEFDDEPAGLQLHHSTRYLLQMANHGPDSNNSQFCFMLSPQPHLNGHHVIFGRVTDGYTVINDIEQLAASVDGAPRAVVTITAAGEHVYEHYRKEEVNRSDSNQVLFSSILYQQIQESLTEGYCLLSLERK